MSQGQGCRLNDVTSTPGGTAIFNCISQNGDAASVEWLVNGTPLENLSINNVTTVATELLGALGGALTLSNLDVEYNMTRITCMTTSTDMSTPADSCTSQLLLQGTRGGSRIRNRGVLTERACGFFKSDHTPNQTTPIFQ